MDLLGIVARQQSTARRPAAGRVVKLREAKSVAGQLIEMRRGDLAAVAPQVGIAEIVRQNEDDVRPFRGVGGQGR